jgi:hypothetical protein
MAKPLPLPVWDRRRGKLIEEWMDDHQPHYESEPQWSLTQWFKSQPLYDRLYALYETSRWSTREIEPFIRRYHIDMTEFEPVRYRSFAEFFDRRFRPGVRTGPIFCRTRTVRLISLACVLGLAASCGVLTSQALGKNSASTRTHQQI